MMARLSPFYLVILLTCANVGSAFQTSSWDAAGRERWAAGSDLTRRRLHAIRPNAHGPVLGPLSPGRDERDVGATPVLDNDDDDDDDDDDDNHTAQQHRWIQPAQTAVENHTSTRRSSWRLVNYTLGVLPTDGFMYTALVGLRNVSEDLNVTGGREAFVKVMTNETEDGETTVEVTIATVNIIVSVFMLMYIPLGMAWVMYYQNGQAQSIYMILLPLTFCTMMVCLDLVNQSLAAIMASPLAITSIQAFAMVGMTGGWMLVQELQAPVRSWNLLKPLGMWLAVAFMFTWFQVVNHLVSYFCSLSERTIFLNLCPAISMLVERYVMPKEVKTEPSFNSKMALSAMVFGAALFSIQFPQFTQNGVAVAFLMILSVVPYRLVQRRMLSVCYEVPIAWLACLDAIVLLPSSTWVSIGHHRKYWQFWDMWLGDPSICLMIVLSLLAFTGCHVCTLMLLKANTATTTLVFQNLASFIEVGLGILFFGDKIFASPLVFIGMAICLFGGLWYAFEVQPKAAPATITNKESGLI